MLITRFCLLNVYSILKTNQTLSNFYQTRVLRPPDSQFKPFIIWRLNHILGCWTGTNHISFSVRLEGSICEVLRLNIPGFRANRLWVYLRKDSWQDHGKHSIYLLAGLLPKTPLWARTLNCYYAAKGCSDMSLFQGKPPTEHDSSDYNFVITTFPALHPVHWCCNLLPLSTKKTSVKQV